MALLWNGGGMWLFPIGASLFFVSWMLGLPYLYASIAALDASRTIMPVAAVVLVIGSSIAPAVAGFFVTDDSLNGVNLYAIVCIVACYAVIIPALLTTKPAHPS
jgi:hypothetical protein